MKVGRRHFWLDTRHVVTQLAGLTEEERKRIAQIAREGGDVMEVEVQFTEDDVLLRPVLIPTLRHLEEVT